MRNFKKILSLVLCMAMMLSVMVVGAGAAFKDQNQIQNTEAVDMCSALNIINGYTDGTFRPDGTITRAEACKMICVALNGGKEPVLGTSASASFTDTKGHWAEQYIESCVAQGIVAGVGGGKFAPNATVTGSQFAKMLLIALGYNADNEGYVGAAWEINVNVQATAKGLYEDLETMDPSVALTRDNAAQMVWNALQAVIVEYDYTLVSNNGSLSSQVVVKDTKTTLLKDKYNALQTSDSKDFDKLIMTGYSWDDVDEEYDYTFSATLNNQTANAKAPSFSSKNDYTDLFGMAVEVVYKDNNDQTVYGMFADGSSIVAEGVLGDIEYYDATYIKIDGVKYKTDDATSAVQAQAENVATSGNLFNSSNKLNTTVMGAQAEAYAMRAIDNDGDNKIDVIVYLPVYAAKVGSVGTKQITLTYLDTAITGTSGKDLKATLKFEDETIYDGVAKDDYVVVTNKVNTADDTYVVEKMESVAGVVTATRAGEVQIDGTWYTDFANETYRLDGNYTFYVIGSYVFYAEQKGAAALTDVLYVDQFAKDTFGDLQAKVYFYDGTSATIDVDDVYEDDGDTDMTVTTKTATADGTQGLFTYSKSGDKYDLTAVGTDNAMGYDYDTSTGITAATDNVAGKIGTYSIADDAVVFISYMDGTTAKVKVVSGAVAKNYNSALAGTSVVVYDTVNGTKKAVVAWVDSNADLPSAKGESGNYGYVVGEPFTSKIDGEKVVGYPIWNGEENVTVYEESTTVKAEKGDFITFDNLGDSMVEKVKEMDDSFSEGGFGFKTAAVDGIDGKTFTIKDSANTFIITDDTVILYVDSEAVEGSETGALQTAADDANNIKYLVKEKDGANSYKLDLLVIEVNNEF